MQKNISMPDDLADEVMDALNEHVGKLQMLLKQQATDYVEENVAKGAHIAVVAVSCLAMAESALVAMQKLAERNGPDDPNAQLMLAVLAESFLPELVTLANLVNGAGGTIIYPDEETKH